MRGGAVALAVALAAVACGPREDVTPEIPVQPGAAARGMALMGLLGKGVRADAGDGTDGGEDEEEDADDGATRGRVAFTCVEPVGALGALARLPCKAVLEALPAKGGAGSPDAGEGSDAGDAPVEVTALDGKVAVTLAPGRYRVTTSREPEYASARFEVSVAPGVKTWGPHEGAVTMARLVDTHGYLAADATDRGFGASDARTLAAAWLAREGARGGDVLDVWSTHDADTRARAVADLLAHLAAGAPVTVVASGDARTYVRLDDARQVPPWDAKRDADFARGVRERRDVVLTNGPFLRVAANGAPIGGVAPVAARTRDVEVDVRVECPPGVSVDRVSILRARGAPVEPRALSLHDVPHAPPGARSADAIFHFRAPKDDAFVVVAEGGGSAYAMTGAIWVDADGNGESLGRKVDDTGDPVRDKKAP